MQNRLGWVLAAILALAVVVLVVRTDRRGAEAPEVVTPTTVSNTGPRVDLVPTDMASVRSVVERVRPAVVQITAEQSGGTGVGSGVIYDARGLILTNNHVIEGARSLAVSLPDGRTFTAKLLGGDPQMDLAVVQIEPQVADPLPVAALGDSGALAVGEWMIAIGNALALPGGPTVTVGVVSALGRAVQEPSETPGIPGPYLYDLIQTDAAINPGNSGGPLLNMAGEVVGINTLAAGGSGDVAAQAIGFAIAIGSARPIADQLVSQGRVSHPFLGISYAYLTPALAAQFGVSVKQGVVVNQVAAGSPAAQAGLRSRDVITGVDGQTIVDETTLGRELTKRKPGDRIRLTVARGTERLTIEVTLGERPSS